MLQKSQICFCNRLSIFRLLLLQLLLLHKLTVACLKILQFFLTSFAKILNELQSNYQNQADDAHKLRLLDHPERLDTFSFLFLLQTKRTLIFQ